MGSEVRLEKERWGARWLLGNPQEGSKLGEVGLNLHFRKKSPGVAVGVGSGREQGQQDETGWSGCCLHLGPGSGVRVGRCGENRDILGRSWPD